MNLQNTNHVPEPLCTIDKIVRNCRDDSSSTTNVVELQEKVSEALLDLVEVVVAPDGNLEDQALNLLTSINDLKQKKLVAVAVLRLIAKPKMNWMLNSPWRRQVVALLDSVFSQNLYKKAKINNRSMSHKKGELLAHLVRNHEDEFQEALSSLTSLEKLRTHRQNLMKVLFNKEGKILVCPFLPKDTKSQLDEMFKRVELYIEQRDDLEGVVEAHQNAIAQIQGVNSLLNNSDTIYSTWIAKDVCQKLLNFIKHDFSKNKATQPAGLSLEPHKKKYPFHLIKSSVDLKFFVRNSGLGYAQDVKLKLMEEQGIRLKTDAVELGRMAPATTQLVKVNALILEQDVPLSQVEIYIEYEWQNFDGTIKREDQILVLEGQRSDINWEELGEYDAYSLEPVTNERKLVGRQDVLKRILRTALSRRTGSSIIRGQKRVGKTSIAKAVESRLKREGNMVVYVEAGDYVTPNVDSTIVHLASQLCKRIKSQSSELSDLKIPDFTIGFFLFSEFLDQVITVLQDTHIIIILDEFDELPFELYKRGLVGNSFFLTLRGVSSKDEIGFLVVGGEKMTYVVDSQGEKLNKWNDISVDYFSRTNWPDYKDLVQSPLKNTIEYDEDALGALYEVTAGNPYFTNLICQHILRYAIERHDGHITVAEVEEAIDTTVQEAGKNSFQHFWVDGIFETGEKEQRKSVRRRKILIALADVLSKHKPAPLGKIAEHPLTKDIPSLETDLKEFVTRNVLAGNPANKLYYFKVPLFYLWLKNHGINDIIATFSDLDVALKERQRLEEMRVTPQEVTDLVGKWGLYKGQPVTTDKVRAWLEQFHDVKEQRAMFTLLGGIKYYSNAYVREKLKEAHGIVRRGMKHNIQRRQLKRGDILVSYLDSPAKSGSNFARLYADEARIYVDNVVEKGKIDKVLRERAKIQAIVFIDDFVGTGETVSHYLSEIDTSIADIVVERNIKVVFVAIVAFIEGWKRIEELSQNLKMKVQTHCCDLLTVKHQCFSEESEFFSDPEQRKDAKQIALKIGKRIEKKVPLGYGNLEMAVVFERNCPNNTLPILWSNKKNWVPLFKRL